MALMTTTTMMTGVDPDDEEVDNVVVRDSSYTRSLDSKVHVFLHEKKDPRLSNTTRIGQPANGI
jgi:hypothetical protein